jgi:hypothetical protein
VAAGSNGSNSAPAPGGYYRDNAPVAWGVIGPNGEKYSSFGIDTVIVIRPGYYQVVFENRANVLTVGPKGEQMPELSPIVQLTGFNQPEYWMTADWSFVNQTDQYFDRSILVVTSYQSETEAATFSIHVFGRLRE